ncbi:solute carrier family 35 member G1-like [Galendromus occidentalis]|uniref:Solute carrier family 35 member G1-like n=1 Tax=Galendromus occidentalis TaxID=34638 RepID=A0AAJ6QY03_9ACAR|nr:solute carrier family 35 member G1-like [Galendromus occidentalis]
MFVIPKGFSRTTASHREDEIMQNDPKNVEGNRSPKDNSLRALWRGLFYASLSALIFSICSVFVKRLHYMHVSQLAAVRFSGILLLSLPIASCRGEKLFGRPGFRGMLCLRAVSGAVSLMLRFYAFQKIPLGDASTIIFSSPLFVALLARLFLREACSVSQILMCFLTVIGIALISKLPMLFGGEDYAAIVFGENKERLYGLLSALSSCVFAATVIVLLRKLKELDPYVIMFNFGWIALVLSVCGLFLFQGTIIMPRNDLDAVLLLALALLSFSGQLMLTLSLRCEQAGPVSVMRATVDIVAVFMWQVIFFNEIPDQYTIGGVIIVMSCVIFTGFRKWALSLPDDHGVKKTMGWFL